MARRGRCTTTTLAFFYSNERNRAPKITLADEELAGTVDLCAIEYSTCRVIDYLLSMHPDWKLPQRNPIKTTMQTCNPNHEKCAKNGNADFRTQKDTLGHIEAGAWRGAADMPRTQYLTRFSSCRRYLNQSRFCRSR